MAVGTTNFPTALDTVITLIEAANNAATTLSGAIDDSVTTITVASTGSFAASGVIAIENELISYTAKTATDFTGCTRGFEGTAAASHLDTTAVEQLITARSHNVMASAIIATQTKLGYGSDTPANGQVMIGNGAGTSEWRALSAGDIPDLSGTYATAGHNHSGVYQPVDADLTAIAALSNDGLLRKTGGTWGMDSAIYLTANQSISLSGDATGSGTTAITVSISSMTGDSGSGGARGFVPAPAAGDAAAGKYLKADGTWAVPPGGGGSGTVTSVALSLPAMFTVSGSPVTTTGTLTAALATQTENTVFAGPTTAPAAIPTFRALVAADIPGVLSITKASNLTSNGFVKTSGGDGTLSVDTATYLTANQTITLSGDVTGSGGTAITATIANDAVTYAKLQNVSATSRIIGRKTALAGDAEECTLSEVLDFIGSAAQGDILYRGAAGWARLGAGTSGHYLQTQGAAANPQWAAVAGGGGLTVGTTAITSGAAGRILYETSGNVLGEIAGSSVDANGAVQFASTARSSGVAQYFKVNTPADTGMTASTESVGVYFGGNGSGATVTRQWSTGALTTQREYVFVAPTYAFVGASTLTTAATVTITGAPVAGANATITTPIGLLISNSSANKRALVINSSNAWATDATPVIDIQNNGTTAFSIGLDAGISSANFINTNARIYIGGRSTGGGAVQDWSSTGISVTPRNSTLVAIGFVVNLNTPKVLMNAAGQFGFTADAGGGGVTTNTADSAIVRAAANILRISNGSTGAGKLIIGPSSASTSAADLFVVGSSASLVPLRVDSASSPSADIVQFTNNASTRWALNSAATTTNATVSDVNGGTQIRGTLTESVTLNTGGTTTDSTIDLPANSIILSVTGRITTTITTATDWKLGDATISDRFSDANATLTSGTTTVGINQWKADRTTAGQGAFQQSTAKVRITTTGTPGAGVIRITIHYITLSAPTS